MSNILVVQTAFAGDLLLTIPLLKNLRKLKPEARLTVYCRKGLGEILLTYHLADELIEVQKDQPGDLERAKLQLQSKVWDWIVSPHESLRTHFLLASLRAHKKTGYAQWWNRFFFHERIVRPMFLPEALRQLALLRSSSFISDDEWSNALRQHTSSLENETSSTTAGLSQEARQAHVRRPAAVPAWATMTIGQLLGHRNLANSARKQFALPAKPLLIMAPGSVWPTKMWTQDGFAEVARAYLKRDWAVALIGTSAERSIADEIAKLAPGTLNLAGKTSFAESAQVLALCQRVLVNDSGAMHLAALSDTPTVSIFGPTDLRFGYRPWQNDALVLEADLGCRPCGSHGAKVCPIGTHDCMKLVSAQSAIRALDSLG